MEKDKGPEADALLRILIVVEGPAEFEGPCQICSFLYFYFYFYFFYVLGDLAFCKSCKSYIVYNTHEYFYLELDLTFFPT